MMNNLMQPRKRPLYLAVAVLTTVTVWTGHDAFLTLGIAACYVGLAISARK